MASDSVIDGDARSPLTVPRPEKLLEGLSRLARESYLSAGEDALAGQLRSVLAELFPGRLVLIRIVDLASDECQVLGDIDRARPRIADERMTIKRSSARATRLRSAISESARLRTSDRWESPFVDVAAGLAIPLVAAGEFYGLLDIGYPLGSDAGKADEPLLLPFANQLSVAIRNERLHREALALRDYQAKLIEHANALILGVGADWRIRVCNGALCNLLGHSSAELVGRDLRDQFSLAERSRLENLIERAESTGGEPVEVELVTRNGARVRTLWTIASIRGRGRDRSVVAIGQDQTVLENLQRQVIHAEKLATLGQLAAGVVHELNNPLTSITVYADFLVRKFETRGTGDEDTADNVVKLRRIRDAAQRILAFARDLVQYAKPSGDEPDDIDLNAVVRQSLSFCEHLFERHSIDLTLELGDGLGTMRAVPGQLEQVVINLVTNAVQACHAGGSVRVTTRADASEILLAVADSGPGISASVAAEIFEPFFTTKSDGKGTGLGLSIVRNIVQQHGGSIALEQGGAGATFVCRFPQPTSVQRSTVGETTRESRSDNR